MAANRGVIDIHSHSLASDGQYRAEEVAHRALAAGIGVWSLCDHDTVAGLDEGARAAERLGIRFIPGIELSAFLEHREIHMLGHFVDPVHPTLRHFEDFLAEKRRIRMNTIVEMLHALGVQVELEEIVRLSGGKTLGRPHVARAIVAIGKAVSVRDAFDRYLGEGKPAYVQRYRLEASDAVKLVRGAGGTTTIAHPGVNHLGREEIGRLAAAGVDGIEVLHPDHDQDSRAEYQRLADAFDLVPTAGSDFHGEAVAPDRKLAMVSMTEEALARLEARRP